MKTYAIIVSGLGDSIKGLEFVTRDWKNHGIEVVVFNTAWKKRKEAFEAKLDRLLAEIDIVSKNGNKVCLVGASAGGSLEMNAFFERKSKISAVINVCGRLREKGFPSLVFAVIGFPAFKESVKQCEKNLPRFTKHDRAKIMTISPIYDGVVPLSAIPLTGAKNIKIPFIYHSLAITAAFVFYKKKMWSFIKQS